MKGYSIKCVDFVDSFDTGEKTVWFSKTLQLVVRVKLVWQMVDHSGYERYVTDLSLLFPQWEQT